MPREADIGWTHGTPVNGNKSMSKCNYCHKVIKGGGVSRLKEHLAGVGGNVDRCEDAPDGVRQLIVDLLRGTKQHKLDKQARDVAFRREINPPPQQIDTSNSDDEDDYDEFQRDTRHAMEQSRAEAFNQEYGIPPEGGSGNGASTSAVRRSRGVLGGIKRFFGQSRSTRAAEHDPTLLRHKSSLQPKYKQYMQSKSIRERVCKIAGKFVHWGGLPPHGVGNNPYWQPLIDEAARAGFGVKAPTGYELMGPILDAEETELLEWSRNIKMKWPTYGVTVMCDGWTGPTNMSLINFLVYCDGCALFDRSVDASANTKDHVYILKLMKEVVDDSGREDVVQIVTDNGSAYKKAGQMLMNDPAYKLFWTPCAAHCIDLMLKEIGRNEKIRDAVAKGRRITNNIYNHSEVLAMMRAFTGGDIVRPAPTRFATNCVALKSLMDKRVTLGQMCASEEWSAWMAHTKYKSEGNVIAEYIHTRRFWKAVQDAVAILEPLVKVLRLVDGDKKPTMPYIYHAMQKMMREIERDAVNSVWVMNIVKQRWQSKMIHPLHEAAYYLNPAFHYSSNLGMDQKLLDGVRVVIEQLGGANIDIVDAMAEIKKFRDGLGSFGSHHAMQTREKLQPAEWWILYGTSAPNLSKYAVKILSQTASSSGCERNWSTFELIHAKRRSKLAYKRLQKLVRVHYNLRLKHRYIRDGIYPNESVDPMDLDMIFGERDDDEENPMYEWIRERAQTDLDTESGRASPYIRGIVGEDGTNDEHLSQMDGVDSEGTESPTESSGRGSDRGGSGGGGLERNVQPGVSGDEPLTMDEDTLRFSQFVSNSELAEFERQRRGKRQQRAEKGQPSTRDRAEKGQPSTRGRRGRTQYGSQAGVSGDSGHEPLTMDEDTLHYTPITTDSEAARFIRQRRAIEHDQHRPMSNEMGSVSSLFGTMSISTREGYSEDQAYLEGNRQYSHGPGYSEYQTSSDGYVQYSQGDMDEYQQYANTMSQPRMSCVGDPRFPYMELAQYVPSMDQFKYQQFVQEYLQVYCHQMTWGQFCANLATLNQFDGNYFEPARHSTWN